MRKKITKLSDQAQILKNKLDSRYSEIATILQPFFNHEITVFYQPSDGIVIEWDDGDYNNINEALFYALAKIENDPFYYKSNNKIIGI